MPIHPANQYQPTESLVWKELLPSETACWLIDRDHFLSDWKLNR